MSKKRTRTTPSEESKMLKEYRQACSHHVVTFETDLSENDIRKGLSSSADLRITGNECTAKMNNRLQQARRTKAFRQAKKNYGYHKDKMKSLDKDSAEYKSHETEKTRSANILNDIYKQYGVTFADLREMLAKLGEEKDVNSVFCLTRAEDIWQGYEKVLYSDGKRVSFKKISPIMGFIPNSPMPPTLNTNSPFLSTLMTIALFACFALSGGRSPRFLNETLLPSLYKTFS